jgi:hypothetical protein
MYFSFFAKVVMIMITSRYAPNTLQDMGAVRLVAVANHIT